MKLKNNIENNRIKIENIRNFSIIAHIDHGKSTLSDRIIQICGGLSEREMSQQVLDSMDLEKERGITIKAQCVTLNYKSKSGEDYLLNLIDTPGHVDFSYEVSRSLYACEGAILLVDSSQGVEAQTLANCYTAIDLGVEILPVLNKIDLPTSDTNKVKQEINDILGISSDDTILCSAKTGNGVNELLEYVIEKIPHPAGQTNYNLEALVIDSWFDNYLGVVSLVRIKNGIIRKNDKILIMSTNRSYQVEELGIFTPRMETKDYLSCGEVGWLCCALKEIKGAPVGSTITNYYSPCKEELPGFKKITPQVYAGLYPVKTDDFFNFRKALEKLSLNDVSFTYEPETSSALGNGFRCGFLGLLHMEIIQERLEREYSLSLIATMPTVVYKLDNGNGKYTLIETPNQLNNISSSYIILEPIAECHILTPKDYVGKILQLCTQKRGKQIGITYHESQVSIIYEIPMNEVVVDLFDSLKSCTKGYASLEYNVKHFQRSDIVKLDIFLNGEKVDAFSLLVHRSRAEQRGREVINYLKEVIPRHQFDIAIQAAIGNQIIARTTIKQFRKNVTGKCYGGDITRKRKLLEKQKEGKKKMKQIGNIEIPKSAFIALLNTDSKNTK